MEKDVQLVVIHTEYIQIDQLLKLEGVIETGGQIKSLIDDKVLFLNGQLVTEKRKKCYPKDIISIDGLDVDFVITSEEE
ncbi:RNA-binding S4 domain-containing protein [Veillonella agrestimuris]|uniref:RNA-binding S4 domain-containing protein n=1 Tax=Veillonella agrestimuris TaxID=2941340 RepID=UPI00203A7E37|nr:RNA-binding S4 domain-containing protein [Veillonella agrestimuris]